MITTNINFTNWTNEELIQYIKVITTNTNNLLTIVKELKNG